jgi:hypothetical protein
MLNGKTGNPEMEGSLRPNGRWSPMEMAGAPRLSPPAHRMVLGLETNRETNI